MCAVFGFGIYVIHDNVYEATDEGLLFFSIAGFELLIVSIGIMEALPYFVLLIRASKKSSLEIVYIEEKKKFPIE